MELDEAAAGAVASPAGASGCDVLDLDVALSKLAAQDERKSRLIEMKYFGGLTNEEIASVLGISVSTVRRDLNVAHAFLHWQMSGEKNAAGE